MPPAAARAVRKKRPAVRLDPAALEVETLVLEELERIGLDTTGINVNCTNECRSCNYTGGCDSCQFTAAGETGGGGGTVQETV
jgi:hypothetical protein